MPARTLSGSENQVVALWLKGESIKTLAAAYDVSVGPIKRILRESDLDLKTIRQERKLSKRALDLRKYSGLSEQEYAEIFSAQHEVCAICKQSCPTGRNLAIDHDHETLQIRGLLCINCNQGLGKFKHDPELLADAISYLLEGCNYCPQMKGAAPWQKAK